MSQKDGIIPFVIKFVVTKVTKVTDQKSVTEPLTSFGFFFGKINNSSKYRTLWKCFTSIINSGKSVGCEVSDEYFILFSLMSLILKNTQSGPMTPRLDVISAYLVIMNIYASMRVNKG